MRGIPKPPYSTDVATASKEPFVEPVVNKMMSVDDTLIPSKIINFINKDLDNCNVLKINVNVNKVKIVNSVIDTGSVYSLISDKLARELGLTIVPSNVKLRVLGNNIMSTLGKTICSLCIGNIDFDNVNLLVFPESCAIGGSLFLGSDFLKENCIELGIKDRKLIKHSADNSSIEILFDISGMITRTLYKDVCCYAAQKVNLSSGTTVSVPINFSVPLDESGQMYYYCDDKMDERLAGRTQGLSGILSKDVKLVLCVSDNESAVIQEGQSLGTVSSVVELPSDEDELMSDDSEPISKIELPELNEKQRIQVLTAFSKMSKVFSVGEFDLGHANVTEHVIKLSDDTPIYQRPRRFSPPIADEIERQCRELHSLDVIEPSISPWNSPIVPIVKKGGGLRMCIDYRKPNKVTVPDHHPIPNLSDSLFGLHGTTFFTRLDLVKSYYQIPVDEGSRSFTAFSTARNHWHFKRLSFGLRNAPSTFQRQIQAVLGSFPSNKVIVYIDDILIMGKCFDDHLDLVCKVLQTLETYKLKINPAKCEFFRSRVEFLGHEISTGGYS